jgi:hypothetical protein
MEQQPMWTLHYNDKAEKVATVSTTACLPFGFNTCNRNGWTVLRATSDESKVTCGRCLKKIAKYNARQS